MPVTHDSPGGHASPQLPQFWGSTGREASQPFIASPSQSVKPASHTSTAQIPASHAAVAFGSEHGSHPFSAHPNAGSLTATHASPHCFSSLLHGAAPP